MWYSFRPTDGGEWNRILGLPCSNYQSASYRGSFDQVWDRSLASKADEAQPASPLARGRETQIQVGSNLGPNTAKLGPKPCTMTQNKARRTNKIDFLQLPWAQEVPSSNLGAPTKLFKQLAQPAISSRDLLCPFLCPVLVRWRPDTSR